MRKCCIVHIGMPKTGSSAIQEALFFKLSGPNVSYANLPFANHSLAIRSMFTDIPENLLPIILRRWNVEKIKAFNKENKEFLIQGFIRNNSSTEIISGEDIFHLEESGLNRLKNFLLKYFHNVIIVGYVRSPKSFMESAFQEIVKSFNISTFDFSIIYPHYRFKLEKFDKVFGKENVMLWKFDPKKFPEGDVVLDFCHRLKIKMPANKVKMVNESISKEVISLLFAYNKFAPEIIVDENTLREKNQLIQTLSTIGKHKFKFSVRLAQSVMEMNRDDINWMEDRLGENLAEEMSDPDNAIGSEAELLSFEPETIQALRTLIGVKYMPLDVSSDTPKDVAKMVQALHMKLAEKTNIIPLIRRIF